MALENLRHLRDDFDDDIPNQKAYGDFKVRKRWWQMLIFVLEDASDEGVIPSELGGEVNKFVEHYTSHSFRTQPSTTRLDIQRANSLIDKICGKRTNG